MSDTYARDLELARQCAAGDERAWERFVREYRPVLYRAADALDPSGGARDLADSLYADLYGIRTAEVSESGSERRSLFRYFQGRSSLATWLRAILAQRYVDRLRAGRRLQPLPDDEDVGEAAGPTVRVALWCRATRRPIPTARETWRSWNRRSGRRSVISLRRIASGSRATTSKV